ncbi:MAG: AAA family ATPase [Acidobacteriaceae bacterium]|nr:AAA family ATPase [Acidobacteriaceae bacterium]
MNSTTPKPPDELGSNLLSVALIGPSEVSRKSIVSALASLHGSMTREFPSYPEMDDVSRLLEAEYDVIIVELDSNPEYSLKLVENICSSSSVTVMVYSEQMFPEILVRCMRAGAREFLTQPITATTIAEAMARASVRRSAGRPIKRPTGKLLVFVGAKGGSGVTTIASNFAVSLAQESGRSAVLIDLNLPLGNAALDLGLTPQYSTATALMNFSRLDSNYLSTLLVKHRSGLSVLAAPDKYATVQPTDEAVEKLLSVTRQDFDYVIVDAGSRFDAISKSLFEPGSTVYLVLQVGISELRNANRLISEFFKPGNVKLEIVLNRYMSRALSLDEASIAEALTVPPVWRIPGDYPAAQTAQNTATPLVLEDSPISRVIRQMTKAACGSVDTPEKKKGFTLFK